jgi:hypothetical protein
VKILPLDEELNTGLENSVRQRTPKILQIRLVRFAIRMHMYLKYGDHHLSKAVPPSLKFNIFLSKTFILSLYIEPICSTMEFGSDLLRTPQNTCHHHNQRSSQEFPRIHTPNIPSQLHILNYFPDYSYNLPHLECAIFASSTSPNIHRPVH